MIVRILFCDRIIYASNSIKFQLITWLKLCPSLSLITSSELKKYTCGHSNSLVICKLPYIALLIYGGFYVVFSTIRKRNSLNLLLHTEYSRYTHNITWKEVVNALITNQFGTERLQKYKTITHN